MSIVDLESRITNDVERFSNCRRSSDSLIYVDVPVSLEDGPGSLDLSVGDDWYHCGDERTYSTGNGFDLRPRDSAVITVLESIRLPSNVMGVVTGKGKYIFKGILISSGKIDPGYQAKLRVGLYNAGQETISFKRGDPFCSCYFIQLESESKGSRHAGDIVPVGSRRRVAPRHQRVALFAQRHWVNILTILMALGSLIVALVAL